ncbi:hypothetical protein E4U47_004135, partial [Claviceps purpurea]
LEQDETDCYIQDIYKYGAQEEKFIVVCMLKEQAALFQQIKSIEVDMSMKRLKGNVNKEKPTGQPLRFKYLDGDGLSAVIMVMSSKACSGQHLAGRAPDGDDRSRTEHLSHVIRTCMVHVGRNIDQAVGPTDTSKFAKRMHELATARDRDEYMAIIEGLMAQTERPKVARWAKHKRQGWVGPGVCQALSNMDPNDWKELRANTNAAEQSGGKSLSFLRDCVLAEGIRTSEVSDRRDMEHFQNRAWTGIAHKLANPSNWNLTYNALRREGKEQSNSGALELIYKRKNGRRQIYFSKQ